MKNSSLAGIALAAIGLVLMYVGIYGWTGAPDLVLPASPEVGQALPDSNASGGGFG
jgi:hypothetical protein